MNSRHALRIGVGLMALLGLMAIPVLAHHGWGGNSDEEFQITGTVQKGVSLAGPHATMKIMANGQSWDLTLAPPARTEAAGLKEGKNITAIHPEAMEKLLHHKWRGNLRELSHTVRAMTLFCNGSVILPEHVVFPPDLESDQSSRTSERPDPAALSNNNKEPGTDLSLANAVKRHVRFIYEQAGRNQRRAAKLLDISRATLARHLRNVAQK